MLAFFMRNYERTHNETTSYNVKPENARESKGKSQTCFYFYTRASASTSPLL
jgi:hypothetical protein